MVAAGARELLDRAAAPITGPLSRIPLAGRPTGERGSRRRIRRRRERSDPSGRCRTGRPRPDDRTRSRAGRRGRRHLLRPPDPVQRVGGCAAGGRAGLRRQATRRGHHAAGADHRAHDRERPAGSRCGQAERRRSVSVRARRRRGRGCRCCGNRLRGCSWCDRRHRRNRLRRDPGHPPRGRLCCRFRDRPREPGKAGDRDRLARSGRLPRDARLLHGRAAARCYLDSADRRRALP